MMILAATICLLSDPLTVECRTVAIRVAESHEDCMADRAPMFAFLKEQVADLPLIYLAVACKPGVVG